MNAYAHLALYAKKYRLRLALALVCATLFGAFSAAPTYLIKWAIDYLLINKAMHFLLPLIAIFVALACLKGIFMYLSSYYMEYVGNAIVRDIREDLFARLLFFPTSFFKIHPSGTILAHFINDIAMIQDAIARTIRFGVRSLFEAAFLITIAFMQNYVLASCLFLVGPIIGYLLKHLGRSMRRSAKENQSHVGTLAFHIQEALIGIREIKACTMEHIEIKRFRTMLDRCFASLMHNVHLVSATPALIEICAMSGVALILYIALRQVMLGSITPGELAAFFTATVLAYQPLKRLIAVYTDIQSGLAATDRVFSLMHQEFSHPTEELKVLPTFSDAISFNQVSFSYDALLPILKNLTLTINRGERIGIIGPSGSGKSTLCDLILGFIKPSSGNIFIDTYNIETITPLSLRTHIGYVGQRTFLFNDTIRSNVAYARTCATEQEIEDACRAAGAHEFIMALPEQYDTMVGEDGTLLSGGQKQRLTIARTLLKKPPILIFDEATSALDQHAESIIADSIVAIDRMTTIIVVSHRPTLIAAMDHIYSLVDGKLMLISHRDFSATFHSSGIQGTQNLF